MLRSRVPPALRAVLGNAAIVRIEAGWVTAIGAEWAYLVTMLLFAYELGGVAAAGAVTTLRMLPPAVLAPFVATIADRRAPSRVLLAVHAGRALVIAAGAAIVLNDASGAWIFLVAGSEGLIAVLHRPTTMSLLPALARSPRELVAGNAVTSTGEAVGVLLGPVVGVTLVAVGGIGLGFAAPAAGFAAAALLVLTVESPARPARVVPPGVRGTLRSIGSGFLALRDHPAAGLLVGLFSAQTFVRGMLTVLLVAASIDLLGLGQSGVGLLNSAFGAGALVGAVLAVFFVGRRRLGSTVTTALAAWGAPIALVGLLPIPALAFPLLAFVGVANAILDVAGFSLVQRLIPNSVRASAFGALEGIVSLTFGLGSLVSAALVTLIGLGPALVAAGLLLPVLAILTRPLVRRADQAAVVPERELELLGGVPLFAPLSMVTLEHVALSMESVTYPIGTTIVEQGAAGDAYYVLATGRADVVIDDVEVATLGPGDGFGEIALLDDRPRTATVIAREPVDGYRLARADFLEAVTGNPSSVRVGERLVAERLAALRP